MSHSHVPVEQCTEIRAQLTNPVYMNPEDARKKDIETGDKVRMHNPWDSLPEDEDQARGPHWGSALFQYE